MDTTSVSSVMACLEDEKSQGDVSVKKEEKANLVKLSNVEKNDREVVNHLRRVREASACNQNRERDRTHLDISRTLLNQFPQFRLRLLPLSLRDPA